MKLFFVSFLVFVSFSCSEEKKESSNSNSETKIDSSLITPIDSSKVKIVLPETSEQDSQEKRIVSKYGEQWSFCDCIKKIDSLNKQSQKEGLSNEKLESILYSKIKIFISEFFNIQKLRLDSFLKEKF